MSEAIGRSRTWRVLRGHRRILYGTAVGLAVFAVLPVHWPGETRPIVAWDIGVLAFLLFSGVMAIEATPLRMAAHAEAQQEGEWTVFWVVIAASVMSLVAVLGEFSVLKTVPKAWKGPIVALVAATLMLSWLVSHVLFALRYAHEFYERLPTTGKYAGGLEFPGEPSPDYWDFVYFAMVLGMTFQVSDVQITARPLRRLATVHGLIGFLFNTVIVALTVNIAAGLL